jgi:PAS domain S-box-containing protein
MIQQLTLKNAAGIQIDIDTSQQQPSNQALIELGIIMFASLLFWTIGLLVYIKKPDNLPAILLCLTGLLIGLSLSANLAGERACTLAVHLAIIATLIVPWLLVHFFLVLPEERSRLRHDPRVLLVYLPAAITGVMYFLIGFADGQPLQDFRNIRLSVYGAGFLLVMGIAIYNYVKAKTVKTRQQMKIILLGCIGAILPFLLISVLPAAIQGHNVMPASFSIVFIASIPLSMAYAIIVKKLFEIDVIIRKGVIYGLVTFFMALLLVLAIIVVFYLGEPAHIDEVVLVAVVLGGLTTLLFGPLSRWVESLVDRIFYRRRIDNHAVVREVSETLSRLTDITAASSIVVNTIYDTVQLSGACLLIENPDNAFYVAASRGNLAGTTREKCLLEQVYHCDSHQIKFLEPIKEVDREVIYAVPLSAGSHNIGILALSSKLSGDQFTLSDADFIHDIAVVTGISLRSMLIIANDILQRKRNEKALKIAAEEWRTTFDSITDMVALLNTNRQIIRVNRSFAGITGYEPGQLVGRYCYQVIHNSDKPHPSCCFDECITQAKTCCHEIYESRLGLYLDCIMSPLKNEAGEINGVVYILKDITRRKNIEAEQQAIRNKAEISSRLATVGEMAAGFAHEINNPLTGVIGFSELLLQEDIPPHIKEHVKYIAEGSNRVKEIVRRMLTFARQSAPVKNSLDIHKLIDNTLDLRSYVLRTSNIEVIKDYGSSLPWVTVDPGQMQQVFMNLIVNAEYALKKVNRPGKLTVSTREQDGYLLISFKDNGLGMSPETLSRLFQPFFTTKEPAEGTGLGLAHARAKINELGGDIEVLSPPDEGAEFIIKLPLAASSTTSVSMPHEQQSPSSMPAQASILVVDDEPSIRAYLQQLLTRSGYRVDQAADSKQTLAQLENHPYDVLLMDIRMPGISGRDLYDEIIRRWPEMTDRVLFITGDVSDQATRKFLKGRKLPFITKPLEREALLEKISMLFE